MIIKSNRLILRPWRDEDFDPFARMNADPGVMEFFPSVLSKAESDALAKRISTKIEDNGWGLWAISVPGISEFIGFIGLNVPSFTAHFTPTVEIGWRLAQEFWGHGYATEGALASLKFGFENLNLDQIVAFTTLQNKRSMAVMEKINMSRNPLDDFDHPNLEAGHKLSRHVLYRINQNEYK